MDIGAGNLERRKLVKWPGGVNSSTCCVAWVNACRATREEMRSSHEAGLVPSMRMFRVLLTVAISGGVSGFGIGMARGVGRKYNRGRYSCIGFGCGYTRMISTSLPMLGS